MTDDREPRRGLSTAMALSLIAALALVFLAAILLPRVLEGPPKASVAVEGS